MARGFKIADAWVEIRADKDELRRDVAQLPGELAGDGERAGKAYGQGFGKGLAGQVEALSARLAKARLQEKKASDDVTLAEKRLAEARESGKAKASAILALEQKISQAQDRLALAHDNTSKAAGRHADAERRLAVELENLGKNAGPAAERGGRDAGDKLSQGIHLALIRNSPLIAAGIAGALALGAPVAIAAATTLFAGIGIAAAAQNDQVRSAWRGLWDDIKSGTQQDAASLVPVLESMAGKIGASFQRLRPQIRDAFDASAPQIDHFTDSVTRAAENAMPGLVHAVERGAPVFAGLGSLAERVGTGLGNLFEGLSTHSAAAGTSLDATGRIIENLLPTLGELLGQGAELASDVLPLMAHGMGLLLAVTRALGPALPPVATAILAFKAISGVNSLLGTFSGRLNNLAAKDIPGVSRAAGGVSGALGRIGAVMPVVGLATGGLAVAFSANQAASDQFKASVDGLFASLREGGSVAEQARAGLARLRADVDGGDFGPDNFLGLGTDTHAILQQAEADYRKLWNAMSPLEQAQSKVAEWTKTLSDRLGDESATSAEVEAAKRRLAYWASEEARQQELLEIATRGVTEAMVEQANQARSRVDAQFAYQDSVDRVQEAEQHLADVRAHLNDTNKDTRTTQEDLDDATRQYNESLNDQVGAAERIATANLPATMDDQQKAILGAKGALDELNKMIASGVTLPPELEAYRQQLIQITGQADGAMLAQAQLAAAVGELGFAVSSVPGERYIDIQAPTDELITKLRDLGFTVTTMPNGQVRVEALTDEAKANIGNLSALLVGVATGSYVPTVDANTGPANAKADRIGATLKALAAQRPTPVVDSNTGPALGKLSGVNKAIFNVASQRPTPIADMITGPFNAGFTAVSKAVRIISSLRPSITASASIGSAESALNYAARTRYSTIIQKAVMVRADGGPVERAITKAATGRVVGPGGPRDDLVPAIGPGGAPWRLSDGEWVVQEMAVRALERQYGKAAMPTINSGRLPVAAADGRPVGVGSSSATAVAEREVHVHFHGVPIDFSDQRTLRNAAVVIRKELIKLDRETR